MNLRLPGGLRAQIVVLVIAALAIAQAISLWLFVDERSLAIRAALGFEAAGRAANVARLIEEAPPALHSSILRAANSPLVRFDMAPNSEIEHTDHADPQIEGRVRALLGDSFSRDVRVELHTVNGPMLPLPYLAPELAEVHRAMMRGELSAIEMNLSIALLNGEWLNVGTRFERPPLQWPFFSTFTFGLTAALILVVLFWYLLTRLTHPLRSLAKAAEALGRGEDLSPLALQGPTEVRDLTSAFNRMQERLTRFVSDRTRILAAVGHDLRSPLTALRVRVELVDDEETRTSLITSIEEMQSMVEATLTFARSLAAQEALTTVSVSEFLARLQDDMVEVFEICGGPDVTIHLRQNAMRRALRNVLENAIRYGKRARLSWSVAEDVATFVVTDDGPGIPEKEFDRVFDPFYRLEGSRSMETGGYGLGLSIARSLVRGHGGDVALSNRPEGGLDVAISVPTTSGTTGSTSFNAGPVYPASLARLDP